MRKPEINLHRVVQHFSHFPVSTKPWIAAALAVIACLAVLAIRQEETSMAMDIDMMVSRGDRLELYLNDKTLQPYRLGVVPHQRQTYHFQDLPSRIRSIRLDPTTASGARIIIYAIRISTANRTLKEYRPADLRRWKFSNLTIDAEAANELALTATTDDPFLIAADDPKLVVGGWLFAQRIIRYAGYMAIGFTLLGLGLVLLQMWNPLGLGRLQAWNPLVHAAQRCVATKWFAGAVIVATSTCVLLLQAHNRNFTAAIDVDMAVDRGDQVELYINDLALEPLRIPVLPNQRHTYHFDRLSSSHLRLIRLDPTDVNHAHVVLYGIRISAGARTVQIFGPSMLSDWQRSGLARAESDPSALVLDSTTNDPILSTNVAIDLPSPNMLFGRLGGLLDHPDAFLLLAMGAFLVIAFCGAHTSEGLCEIGLIAVVMAAAHPLAKIALDIPGRAPPVRVAVGLASYTGYPKSQDYLAGYLLLALSIGTALIFWRWLSPRQLIKTDTCSTPGPQRRHWLAHGVVLLLLLVYFQPDLRGGLSYLKALAYGVAGWDETNAITWNYLVESGAYPFRDFWYPYAGFYLQLLPFPAGYLASLLFQILPLWFLYLGLYYVTGRRVAQSMAVFLLVVAPVLLGYLPASSRYLLAVDVGLLYVAAVSTKKVDWGLGATLGICAAYAFFCEPSQLAYAAGGILAEFIVAFFSGYTGLPAVLNQIRDLLRTRALYAGIPLGAGVLLSVAFYAAEHMLPGLWGFEASVADQANYGALPARVADWVRPVLMPDGIFLVLFLLTAYTIYRLLRRSNSPDMLTVSLLVVCAMGFASMQKQILRPHAMAQVRIYPYIGLLLYGVAMWKERPRSTRPFIAMFAGGVLALVWPSTPVKLFYRQALHAAPLFASNADTLLKHAGDIRELHRTRFTPARFAGLQEQNAVVDNLRGNGLTASDRVYVLGDDALFYILLSQRPPYLSNCYNMSPIYEQQRVLQWLEATRPKFVIWAPGLASFEIPHAVRIPLIFDYVVRRYVFLRAVGTYHILRAIRAGEGPDPRYWRQALTGGIHLGFIPARAKLSDFDPCSGQQCVPFLVVQQSDPRGPTSGEAEVRVHTATDDFSIWFNLSPDTNTYIVPLQRLWFWSWLESGHPEFQPRSSGLRTALEWRSENKCVLY